VRFVQPHFFHAFIYIFLIAKKAKSFHKISRIIKRIISPLLGIFHLKFEKNIYYKTKETNYESSGKKSRGDWKKFLKI